MYKIVTFEESFIFVGESEENDFALSSESGRKIKVLRDTELDYLLEVEDVKSIYRPDLCRAIMTYIYRVNGYPTSEYEIKIVGEYGKITLPNSNGKIGGNVGKCKSLFSNYEENDFYSENVKACISCDAGDFLIAVSDNIEIFDSKRLLCQIYRSGNVKSINSVLVLSYGGREAKMRVIDIPGKERAPMSLAFSAAFHYLSERYGIKEETIFCGPMCALCESTPSGTMVYDLLPRAYKAI